MPETTWPPSGRRMPRCHGSSWLWAVGDCAAVPDGAGGFYPPTAQHGMREAVAAAKNIARAVVGEPLKPFRYKTIGMLASIGHHSGVAMLFGVNFSGFIAWWMWRSVYVVKASMLGQENSVSCWIGRWTFSSAATSSKRSQCVISKLRLNKSARVRARRNRNHLYTFEPKHSVQAVTL